MVAAAYLVMFNLIPGPMSTVHPTGGRPQPNGSHCRLATRCEGLFQAVYRCVEFANEVLVIRVDSGVVLHLNLVLYALVMHNQQSNFEPKMLKQAKSDLRWLEWYKSMKSEH